jgi:hypothetical protein
LAAAEGVAVKHFLLRAGGKIRRFFWSWGFLKFVLWMITLVILFYAEEDWRGARAWAATKAKWEAQGETFDIMKLAPRPVPDDENLAALPLFKMEPDPDPDPQRHGYLVPLKLEKDFSWDWKSSLPRGGNWEQGKLTDAEKNRALVGAAYVAAFKTAPTSLDAFAQFSALVPAMAALRTAAASRSFCRFEQSYRFDLPGEATISLLSQQIALSKFLTADAILALDAKEPNVALADITTHGKLLSGMTQQPMLVAGLIAIGMEAIDHTAIYEGLATHVWDDGQLAEQEQQLAKIDFLASYRNGLRGEACISIATYDRLKPRRADLISELNLRPETNPPTPPKQWDPTPFLWPDGWIDLMKARAANFDLAAAGMVDIRQRILSPDTVDRFIAEIQKKRSTSFSYSLFNLLLGDSSGLVNHSAQNFAIAQVRLDETRIACALERYHLAHGAYPATLDELEPACIDSVPHDVIDGKPYHYQARADGTFQLYSVGWNETDDGGAFTFKKDNPKAIDYENGDWPWPTPK